MTINNLRDSANGTFVTLDDYLSLTRGVGQQHRQLSEDPVDATVPQIVLDYFFMGEESEVAPHIAVKDRKSSAYFSTSLDSKTSQYTEDVASSVYQKITNVWLSRSSEVHQKNF